jgi:hypothetical protein
VSFAFFVSKFDFMKTIFIAAMALLLLNCDSDKATSEPIVADASDNLDTLQFLDTMTIDSNLIQPVKTIYVLTETDKKSLGKYISKAEIKSLEIALDSYSNTDSDTVVIASFLQILEVTDTLKDHIIAKADYSFEDENGDYYPFNLQTELASLEKSIPGFRHSCIAECTEYDCIFNLSDFKSRTLQTKGVADDEFFEILNIAESDYMTTAHQFRAWFAQMWDYGGASLLGSGIHKEFLEKSQNYMSKYNLGRDLLKSLQMEAYGDMQHGVYMNSAKVVAKELKEIFTMNVFSAEENEKLIQLFMKIKTEDYNQENVIGGILQFDCETGDCNFGG